MSAQAVPRICPAVAARTGSLATATITNTSVAITMSENTSADARLPRLGPEWTAGLTPYA